MDKGTAHPAPHSGRIMGQSIGLCLLPSPLLLPHHHPPGLHRHLCLRAISWSLSTHCVLRLGARGKKKSAD